MSEKQELIEGKGLERLHLSITHDARTAAAVVVLEGGAREAGR